MKEDVIEGQSGLSPIAVEVGLDAVRSFDISGSQSREEVKDNKDAAGGAATGDDGKRIGGRRPRSSLVGTMLDGYYDIVRRAVVVTVLTRLLGGSVFVWALWRWRRRILRR